MRTKMKLVPQQKIPVSLHLFSCSSLHERNLNLHVVTEKLMSTDQITEF